MSFAPEEDKSFAPEEQNVYSPAPPHKWFAPLGATCAWRIYIALRWSARCYSVKAINILLLRSKDCAPKMSLPK